MNIYYSINSIMKKCLGNFVFHNNDELIKNVGVGYLEKDGHFFLEKFASNARYDKSYFGDSTGYECFVNSFHPNDYVDEDIINSSLTYLIKVINDWTTGIGSFVNGILSYDYMSEIYTIKVYIDRKDDEYINYELESYQDEGILFMSSIKHMNMSKLPYQSVK